MSKKPNENLPMNWRPFALAGYLTIFLTFGVAGGWAAVTMIDRAIVAQATVSLETNRKVVQHYEGGIVQEILVKEGDQIETGQVVVRLQQVQAKANKALLEAQLMSRRTIEARLQAEREDANEIKWPEDIKKRQTRPGVARVMADQTNQFQERRSALKGQVAVLKSRIEQLKNGIQGLELEQRATKEQVSYINRELEGMRRLREDDLIPITRLYSMERERTRLEGAIGRAAADIAKSKAQISETEIQIAQLKKQRQEEVSGQLAEIRQGITDHREKLTVAQDVLKRIDIVSPRSGSVQNLKVAARGQVIRSGEPLMEIVPDSEPFVVHAKFAPEDIDGVQAGQTVEIRFISFDMRNTPVILGKLETVSHDSLVDESTRLPYFLGVISIARTKIPEDMRKRLRSGMPAQVIAAAGERTVLNYIVSPLLNSLRTAFKER
ncbi:MAG: HlyD family type I secretion periplasmic adaptor subunit [Hyphomicrobiaceae bacterium]